MVQVRSPRQRFVEVHGIIASHFRPPRHLLSGADYRKLRSKTIPGLERSDPGGRARLITDVASTARNPLTNHDGRPTLINLNPGIWLSSSNRSTYAEKQCSI
jgi:hypothetical protein